MRADKWYAVLIGTPNLFITLGLEVMPGNQTNSRVLRRLADDLVQKVAENTEILPEDQEDLVTSLVRQWITYDGNATLFFQGQQVYLMLGRTPLGKPQIEAEPAQGVWMKQLTGPWKIDEDLLPEVIDQLNLSQSAEVTNSEGEELRLWVNPQERSHGVESSVSRDVPASIKRDYQKIAVDVVEQHLGALDVEEIEALACSIASQWKRYDGCACLFVDGSRFTFVVSEQGDGNCLVRAQQADIDLKTALYSLGFSGEVVPEVIARINLGQEVEFRDRAGVRSRLWHNPKERQFVIQPLGALRAKNETEPTPVFCPRCTAVLRLWQPGERFQTCLHCGITVSR